MNNVREIPGYYYDKEKNKYFKIQAGTSISAYSSRDVKRRKVEEAEAEALQVAQARQKERIKRCQILNAPLGGGLLTREFGSRRLDLVSQIVVDGLVRRHNLFWSSLLQGDMPSMFTISRRPDLGPSIVDYHVSNENQLGSIRGNIENGTSEVRRIVFNSPGLSTSVNVHQATQRVLSTWLAGNDDSGIGIASAADSSDTAQGFELEVLPAFQLGPGTSRGLGVNVYASTAAPPQSSILFAIGTSHGLMKIDKQSCDPSWLTPKLPQSKYEDAPGFPKDTFALEFLHNDPSVLLSGGRRGILNITDLRIPIFGESADIICHPSSIAHIRQLDIHRIIVAGLNSSLCQYDLRFRKLDTKPLVPCLQDGRKTEIDVPSTSPLLRYPDYHNSSIVPIGFDVDLEAGVVAAAQQSKSGWDAGSVCLYSLRTGQLLRTLGKKDIGVWHEGEESAPGAWVQCIRFARDDATRSKSLYMGSSSSQNIIKYSL